MSIKQGEVWLVKFYPQVGSEISKLRPAVIISHDTVGKLPLKTIVPVTDWKSNYTHYPWMLQVNKNKQNGLSKTSAIDCFQVKNFSNNRLMEKMGTIDDNLLKQIHETAAKTFNPNYTLN